MVAIANYLVQRWRYSVDRLASLTDHFCKEVNSAADLATEYWLLNPVDPTVQLRCTKMEAELIGRQLRLQHLYLALAAAPGVNAEHASKHMLDLNDVMTGGNFSVPGRAIDATRAKQVQALAAQINGDAWKALQARSRKLR